MKDIINGLIERFRRQHVQARRYVAMMLVLALLTTLFVNWQLHGVGISMTADYHCGYEEHQHTAACYEKVLTCGYEEGEPETPVTSSDSSADPVSAYSAAERKSWKSRCRPSRRPSGCPMSTRCLLRGAPGADPAVRKSTSTPTTALTSTVRSSAASSSISTTTAATPPSMSWCAAWTKANWWRSPTPPIRKCLPPAPWWTCPLTGRDHPGGAGAASPHRRLLHRGAGVHHPGAPPHRGVPWPIPRPTWRLPRNGRPRPTWP